MEVITISNLIPLKIPNGWTIHINALSEELYNPNDSVELLKENLLLLSSLYSKRIIDVGWYPEGGRMGEYCLLVIKMGVNGINTMLYSSEEDIIYSYRTRDIYHLVDKINETLNDTLNNTLNDTP